LGWSGTAPGWRTSIRCRTSVGRPATSLAAMQVRRRHRITVIRRPEYAEPTSTGSRERAGSGEPLLVADQPMMIRVSQLLGDQRRARLGRQRLSELGARVDAEFGEDFAEVILDGVHANEEPRADLHVREAVAG
jgi:hypothetical protein